MHRKDREITDTNEIEDIIKKAIVCRIALVDNYEPYIVPVNFGYERNTIYFHSALEGRKIEIIKKNNKVCFEMEIDVKLAEEETSCDDVKLGSSYRSVIGVGKAQIMRNDEEKVHGLQVLTNHYLKGEFNFSKSALNSVVVVKIDIQSITGKKA